MWENITSSTSGAATTEIIIMLLGAFILGYLLRFFIGSKGDDSSLRSEVDRLRSVNSNLKTELDACNKQSPAVAIAAIERPTNPDDLKKIEGIGPKIEEIMNNGGVWTYASMAEASAGHLNDLILAVWPNNKVHDAGTWPQQAAMARDGKWDELKSLQDQLKGGK
ncbi:MAG: hypothetical protein HKN45_00910 [Flavobacteriales bacterium]|nr:hypothetical protein [Flavobacteriales bacterium]